MGKGAVIGITTKSDLCHSGETSDGKGVKDGGGRHIPGAQKPADLSAPWREFRWTI